MITPFEEAMKKHRDTYWVLKQGDGVWAIVNHNAYLKEKKGQDNGKPLITITPYSLDGSLYQLMMINNPIRKWVFDDVAPVVPEWNKKPQQRPATPKPGVKPEPCDFSGLEEDDLLF